MIGLASPQRQPVERMGHQGGIDGCEELLGFLFGPGVWWGQGQLPSIWSGLSRNVREISIRSSGIDV